MTNDELDAEIAERDQDRERDRDLISMADEVIDKLDEGRWCAENDAERDIERQMADLEREAES